MGVKTTRLSQSVSNVFDSSVMIVDDSLAICRKLARQIEHAGFKAVHTATDSRIAFAEICEFKPRVLILDIVMPNVSGLQILDRVIAKPRLDDTIVIVLSSIAPEVEQLAIKAGASAVLPKSTSSDEIVRILSTSIRIADRFGTR